MKDIQYIIWDWNGTLLNDVSLCITAINHLLSQERIPTVLDKEAYQKVFQFPIIQYYEKLGFDFTKSSFDTLSNQYMTYYQPKSLQCELYEDAYDVISNFHKQGYKQAILSASKLENLLIQVRQYDITKYFDHMLGLDNIHAHSKLQLAENFFLSLHIDSKHIVVIGDSVHDSEVAKQLGCHCILIANGHEHKNKLLQTGYCVVDTIKEVASILKKESK